MPELSTRLPIVMANIVDEEIDLRELLHEEGQNVALVASGKVLGTWTLAREYGFTYRDGAQPDWGHVFYGEIRKNT